METTDWVQIIAALLAGAGVKELWSVIKNRNNNEAAITQKELEIEAGRIEELRLENIALKKQIYEFKAKINILELDLDRNLTKFRILKTVVETLAQGNEGLLEILAKMEIE